jgi:hypothetical protein
MDTSCVSSALYPARDASASRILSQHPCPSQVGREILLYFKSGGRRQVLPLRVCRPMYFDEVIVAQRRLERQMSPGGAISGGSLRKIARSAMHGFQRTAVRYLPAIEMQGPVLDFRAIEANNIAHLLLFILPCCVQAQELLGQPANVLFTRLNEPFRTLAERFGVSPSFTNRPVSGDFIQFFGTRGLVAYDLTKSAFDCEPIQFLPRAYDKFEFRAPVPVNADKLFVARRGDRSLLNHAEVERFLVARGYATVFFEDYSIEQQLSLGANARDVVSVHGAAMSYLLLATKLNSVVELFPPHVYHQVFASTLPLAGSYKALVPDFDPEVGFSGWSEIVRWKSKPFKVDLEQLESALDF